MDLYAQILAAFAELPCAEAWPELLDLLRRVAARRPQHWLLPVRACVAVGGSPEQAIPAALAIACCHISIILVDDMLDCDPRGEYRQIGAAAAANMASALQAAALAAIIAHGPSTPGRKLAALESANEMLLHTTIGQYWDVQGPSDEAHYWQVAQAKSSPFFGAALQLGALLGGATPRAAMRLKALGALYGEMIQIHDDLGDSMAIPANPDWLLARFPLPVLYARQVPHPERERFVALCGQVSDEAALREAQQIIIRCGALGYCVEHLLRRHEAMQGILAALRLRQRAEMDALAQAVIAPVWQLFEGLGCAAG